MQFNDTYGMYVNIYIEIYEMINHPKIKIQRAHDLSSIRQSSSFSRDIDFTDGKFPKMGMKKKKKKGKSPDQDLTMQFYRQFAKHFRLFRGYWPKDIAPFWWCSGEKEGPFFPLQIMRNRERYGHRMENFSVEIRFIGAP